MRPKDVKLAEQLSAKLDAFHNYKRPLQGIQNAARKSVFLEQVVESIHRIQYIERIQNRPPNIWCTDPNSDLFDPYKAALIYQRQQNIDEAFWLVFLSVHFGKHRTSGWRTMRDVYGRLSQGGLWDWDQTSKNTAAFRKWLDTNKPLIARLSDNDWETWTGPDRTRFDLHGWINRPLRWSQAFIRKGSHQKRTRQFFSRA